MQIAVVSRPGHWLNQAIGSMMSRCVNDEQVNTDEQASARGEGDCALWMILIFRCRSDR